MCLAAVLAIPTHCQELEERFFSDLVPDFLRLQFAGEAGLLSLGAGYQWWGGKIEPELDYGYIPKSVGGVEIQTVSLKTTWSPARLETPRGMIFPFLAGFSINVPLGKNYHLVLKERFRDYYWPSGLYFWFFTGLKATKLFGPTLGVRGLSAVVELGTVDSYAIAFFRNDNVGLGDILSLALAGQILL